MFVFLLFCLFNPVFVVESSQTRLKLILVASQGIILSTSYRTVHNILLGRLALYIDGISDLNVDFDVINWCYQNSIHGFLKL
jgi:hypothetical protein